jgi:four helix bundle protein
MRGNIKSFRDLKSWSNAHELTIKIYKITEMFPGNEKYNLISQLRRASSSISANIAEGFERFHFKDKVRFYYQARGSLAEVENFITLSKDLSILNPEAYNKLLSEINETRKILNGLIRATNKYYSSKQLYEKKK